MNCVMIRCRACTPVASAELSGWLQGKVAELREEEPDLLVRVTRLAQDLADGAIDDGWLIEVEPAGEQPDRSLDSLAAALEPTLRDLRILGLAPVVLAPVESRAVRPLSRQAGQRANAPV